MKFLLSKQTEDKNTNIINKQANTDQNTSIYWQNHTCKFLALSTVWAGVLQQVSEEMLVPKTEREGSFHKKTPKPAISPTSNRIINNIPPGEGVQTPKPNQAAFGHNSSITLILSSNLSTKLTQVFYTFSSLRHFLGI